MDTQKVVLITGTSTGIGRLTAETCARKGYTVFASMRHLGGRNAAHHDALQTLAAAEGLALHVVELDVTDDASVEHAMQAVLQEAGHIDVLVHNAGVSAVGITETFTPEQAQQLFAVNVFGALRMNRAVLPHMRQQGSGLLVYISSAGGRVVFPHNALYCASKFALEALAESYHYQLFSLGIDSVILEPPSYRSAMSSNWIAPADPARGAAYGQVTERIAQVVADIGQRLTQGRSPHELAEAVAALIAMPAEARHLRVPLGRGATERLTPINQVTAHAQATMAEQLGVAGLLTRASHNATDA